MLRARILDILIAFICIALLSLSALTNIEPHGHLTIAGQTLGDTCTFHRITTVNCPFCGIARSMVALFDGGIRDSLRFHPLGVCLAVVFALTTVAVGVAVVRQSTPVIETRVFSAVMLSLIVASLGLWTVGGLQRCWSPAFTSARMVK